MNNKNFTYEKIWEISERNKNFRSRNIKVESYATKQERNDTTCFLKSLTQSHQQLLTLMLHDNLYHILEFIALLTNTIIDFAVCIWLSEKTSVYHHSVIHSTPRNTYV